MGAAVLRQSIDEASAAHFVLDSHHLAMLDRFVAQARRHAKRSGHQFTGVTVEIHPDRPVSVHVADLEPLALGLEAGPALVNRTITSSPTPITRRAELPC